LKTVFTGLPDIIGLMPSYSGYDAWHILQYYQQTTSQRRHHTHKCSHLVVLPKTTSQRRRHTHKCSHLVGVVCNDLQQLVALSACVHFQVQLPCKARPAIHDIAACQPRQIAVLRPGQQGAGRGRVLQQRFSSVLLCADWIANKVCFSLKQACQLCHAAVLRSAQGIRRGKKYGNRCNVCVIMGVLKNEGRKVPKECKGLVYYAGAILLQSIHHVYVYPFKSEQDCKQKPFNNRIKLPALRGIV